MNDSHTLPKSKPIRGLFVVILGPDGTGKSTLAERLVTLGTTDFSGCHHFHWRPGLLPQLSKRSNKGANTEPPAPPQDYAYGNLISLVRFTYYLLDFILGYWWRIYPSRRKGILVLGERWYFDVIINPARYGFKVPKWLRIAAGKLVPKPDLTVLLTGDPEIIHARKKELDPQSIKDQLTQLTELLETIPNTAIVATDVPIQESAKQLVNLVLNAASDSSTPCWRAFPSTSNVRLWISDNDKNRNIAHLYTPYSTSGTIAKWLLTKAPIKLWRNCDPMTCNWLKDIQDHGNRTLGRGDLSINLSIGTPGPHQKHTAQVFNTNGILAYIKIATSPAGRSQLERERDALIGNPTSTASGIHLPKVLGYEINGDSTLLYLSAPDNPGQARPLEISQEDILFLEHLLPTEAQERSVRIVIEETLPQHQIETINNINVSSLLQDVVETLNRLAPNGMVHANPAHGDFAPWNTHRLSSGHLYVFDWEYYEPSAPMLFDLFHRVYMANKLVRQIAPVQACRNLLALWDMQLTHNYIRRSGIAKEQAALYALLYLLKCAGRSIVDKQVTDRYVLDSIRYVLSTTETRVPRRRVLVSAYACEPDKGSEPGVGWNWVKQIAASNDVWLMTRNNNRDSIEHELKKGGYSNIHPIYVDPPRYLTFWKKKQRGVRTYYYIWQFAALVAARRLHRNVHFDIGHHVTFVNDWMWTFFALMPIPYIWGPIGSNPRLPKQLLPNPSARRRDLLRHAIQTLVRIVDPLYWLSAIRASRIVLINQQLTRNIPLRWLAFNKLVIEPAIGIEEIAPQGDKTPHSTRSFLFVGHFIPVKGPHLAIQAFGRLYNETGSDIRLTMVGEGPEKRNLERYAENLNIADRVNLIDWVPRSEVFRYFRDADVFLFPSMEGGGMVVLEAMMLGLPVICLDYGGPGQMVGSTAGCKTKVTDEDSVIKGLAICMKQLLDPAFLTRASDAAKARATSLYAWQRKAQFVNTLYDDALSTQKAKSDKQ